MKKVRNLRFLGILGVVIAVLFLVGISFTQAQVKIQGKPVKPPPEPEATWVVFIPQGGNTMLLGDGFDYIDGVDNIEVTVEKNSPGAWRKDNDFVTYIGFKISNPTDRYVNFDGVSLIKHYEGDYPYIDPDYGKPCSVFPPPYDGSQSSCDACDVLSMQGFLNGEFHPYTNTEESTYRYFIIELRAFDKDILTMDDGESYLLGQEGHYHDYIDITLRYQTGDRAPTYHNIDFSKSAHLGEASLNPFNIWITRTGDNTWKIEVGKIESPQFLFLEEYYYETSQRGNKTTIAGWYSTLFAGGAFNFTFDLIRNPQSSIPPAAPTNLYAGAPACEQIDLSWTDNSDNESGFEIERRIDGLNFTQIDTVGPNAETYNDTGLDGDTQYWYRVRAYNDTGGSDYSDTASATTFPCGGTELPAAPTGLTANARGKTKIALNWTDNSNNEEGFIIYRGSSESALSWLAEVGANTSSYVDNTVDSKTTYHYQVCAYNSEGESCSNTTSATTK